MRLAKRVEITRHWASSPHKDVLLSKHSALVFCVFSSNRIIVRGGAWPSVGSDEAMGPMAGAAWNRSGTTRKPARRMERDENVKWKIEIPGLGHFLRSFGVNLFLSQQPRELVPANRLPPDSGRGTQQHGPRVRFSIRYLGRQPRGWCHSLATNPRGISTSPKHT